MKRTLLLINLIPFLTFVCAQSAFSVFPADLTAEVDDVSEYETVAYSYVVNTSDEELDLMWRKDIQSKPEGWGVAICDFNACWEENKDSATITLMPGDTSNLDVHIRPYGVEGNAVVKLEIFDLNNREDEFVNTYTFNDATSPVFGERPSRNIRLYPNPTAEYFSVDGVDQLKEVLVVNLVGQEVKRFSASDNARYKVSDLMRGLYLVRLVNKEDKIVKTIRLSKR